jgi:hypothetical protein
MDEAPWNTAVPAGVEIGAQVGCEGSFHHLIALFCTVAGKLSCASTRSRDFSNEIKHLERFSVALPHRKLL